MLGPIVLQNIRFMWWRRDLRPLWVITWNKIPVLVLLSSCYPFSVSTSSDFRSVTLFLSIPMVSWCDDKLQLFFLVTSNETSCWSDGMSSVQGLRAHIKRCRKSGHRGTGMLARLVPEPLTHTYTWLNCSVRGWSKVPGSTRSANLHLAGWYERKEGNIRLIMCYAKMHSLTWNLMLTFSF